MKSVVGGTILDTTHLLKDITTTQQFQTSTARVILGAKFRQLAIFGGFFQKINSLFGQFKSLNSPIFT